jgi:hypothetical protein
MERGTKLLLGGVLTAAGIGAGAYVASQYLQGRISGSGLVRNPTLATEPPQPIQSGIRDMTLVVSWENPTNKTVTYAVLAATLDDNMVTGHWFSSIENAREAVRLYQAGDVHGSQILATNPFYRVATVQVGPGKRGQARLYEVLTIKPGQQWHVWIQTANDGRLSVSDTLGTAITSLPKAVAALKVQVT